MPQIKFGPAGLGPVKEAVERLEEYKRLGLKACEVAFTYGIYIKKQEDALAIGRTADKLGIKLSIHAPYWINLNSSDKEKLRKSRERILECLKTGTWLNAKYIVFHPGYYGKNTKEKTYEKISQEIIEIQKIRKEKKYTPELAPETTGKVNVFGSIEEIANLVSDSECSFCIDFAHILAREKNYSFEKIKKYFEKHKNWHIHFSGIEYGEKGEKRHKTTQESELKLLLNALPKNKDITIINESPDPVEDSLKGMKIYNNLKARE